MKDSNYKTIESFLVLALILLIILRKVSKGKQDTKI